MKYSAEVLAPKGVTEPGDISFFPNVLFGNVDIYIFNSKFMKVPADGRYNTISNTELSPASGCLGHTLYTHPTHSFGRQPGRMPILYSPRLKVHLL